MAEKDTTKEPDSVSKSELSDLLDNKDIIMDIKWININEGLPEIGEEVLTCNKEFPADGFEWECIEIDGDWSNSYSVSHWARLQVEEV